MIFSCYCFFQFEYPDVQMTKIVRVGPEVTIVFSNDDCQKSTKKKTIHRDALFIILGDIHTRYM